MRDPFREEELVDGTNSPEICSLAVHRLHRCGALVGRRDGVYANSSSFTTKSRLRSSLTRFRSRSGRRSHLHMRIMPTERSKLTPHARHDGDRLVRRQYHLCSRQ